MKLGLYKGFLTIIIEINQDKRYFHNSIVMNE